MLMNTLYANVLLHSFEKFYGLENRIRKKGNADSFPFFLFTVCTVESRKPVALCLDVKINDHKCAICECSELFCMKDYVKSTYFK